MGRLEQTFSTARARGRKVLVAYLCVGDPSVDESVDLAVAAVEAGADVVELGVPFSDPTADGETIARASLRALSRGGGLAATLKACGAVRSRTAAPIVLFGYYNPLVVRGLERAVREAKDAGVDGLLVVDLPVDASGLLRGLAGAQGLAVVPLLAPTSAPARAIAVKDASAASPSGFLYYVSVTGVTGPAAPGASARDAAAALPLASREAGRLGALTGLPAVVGFGVDSGEKARAAAASADGVVVGSALVRRVEQGATPEARRSGLVEAVTELRSALDG